jgi:hypothetical protein
VGNAGAKISCLGPDLVKLGVGLETGTKLATLAAIGPIFRPCFSPCGIDVHQDN